MPRVASGRQLSYAALMSAFATGVFRSLRSFNYRVLTAGALVSNVGTWMQRTAQDWLVLTQLTHHNASAVCTVMALQFAWERAGATFFAAVSCLLMIIALLGVAISFRGCDACVARYLGKTL